MTALFQLYPDLEPAVEAALRSSIRRWGVIYPIVVDQHGHVIDGHHRQRIARELGLNPKTEIRRVRNEDEARELARTLNEDRRQMPAEMRRPIVADLRNEGHSLRAIAGATGASKSQVDRDVRQLSRAGQLPRPTGGAAEKPQPPVTPVTPGEPAARPEARPRTQPAPPPRVRGTDGKTYPGAKPEPSDDERMRLNFARVHARYGTVVADIVNMSPARVAEVLNDADSDTDWHMIEESYQSAQVLAGWFKSVLNERPKPFSVVQGGRS